MKQWEYDIVWLDGSKSGQDRRTINRMGAEGWELVSISAPPGKHSSVAYFKREIPS